MPETSHHLGESGPAIYPAQTSVRVVTALQSVRTHPSAVIRSTLTRSFNTKGRADPRDGVICTKRVGVCPYSIRQISRRSKASILHRTAPRESVTCIERTVSQRGSKLSLSFEHPPITVVTKTNLAIEATLICPTP